MGHTQSSYREGVGTWEGKDQAKKSLEMDIVAPLMDGRVMTGGVKWNTSPLTPGYRWGNLRWPPGTSLGFYSENGRRTIQKLLDFTHSNR